MVGCIGRLHHGEKIFSHFSGVLMCTIDGGRVVILHNGIEAEMYAWGGEQVRKISLDVLNGPGRWLRILALKLEMSTFGGLRKACFTHCLRFASMLSGKMKEDAALKLVVCEPGTKIHMLVGGVLTNSIDKICKCRVTGILNRCSQLVDME